MSTRQRVLLAIASALVLICALLAYRLLGTNLVVSVTNHGPDDLRDVRVHVTGASYHLGDLSAGTAKRVGVWPTSESHVEVEYVDGRGETVRVNAGGYFEPGYKGEYAIALADGRLAGTTDNVQLYP